MKYYFIQIFCVLLCLIFVEAIQDVGHIRDMKHLSHLVGTNVTVECQIKNFGNIDPSKIKFNVTIKKEDISTRIVEDRSLIKVKKDNIVEYTVRNASRGSYSIGCYYHSSNQSIGIDIIDFNVGSEPEEITSYRCVNYHFQKLVCNFTKPYNPIKTEYFVDIMLGNQNIHKCALSIHPTLIECTFTNMQPFEKYIFLIKSNNTFGSRNETIKVNLLSVTIPPKFLITYTSITESSVEFTWNFTNWIFYEFNKNRTKSNIIFSINICPEDLEEECITMLANDGRKFVVDNLNDKFFAKIIDLPYPYYNYKMEFRAKMKLSPNNESMWSDSYIGTFRTAATRPLKTPEVHEGSFSNQKRNEITIFWKDVEKYYRNGPSFEYKIDVLVENRKLIDEQCRTNAISATFNLNQDNNYVFKIFSKNAEGISSNYSKIVVKKVDDNSKPVDVWRVSDSVANSTSIRWNLTNAVQQPDNYTIFWCLPILNDYMQNCSTSINFKTISPNSLFYKFEPATFYKYGISANYKNHTSGIIWNTCISTKQISLKEIDFEVLNDDIKETEIKLKWQDIDCGFKSTISGYYVYICEIDKLNNVCTNFGNITIGSEVMTYTIEHLKPFTTYNVSVNMYTEKQVLNSTYISITTKMGAPSEPRNFELTNITVNSVSLKWDIPNKLNGILKEYHLLYNDQKTIINQSTVRMYTLDNLLGNTFYNISLYAVNMQDNKISKSSQRLTFRTLIGNPSRPVDGKWYFSNYTAYWQKPDKPNGYIDFYKLEINGKISYLRSNHCTFVTQQIDCRNGDNLFITAYNVNISSVDSNVLQIVDVNNNLCKNDETDFIIKNFNSFSYFTSEVLEVPTHCYISNANEWIYCIGAIICMVFFILAIKKFRNSKDIIADLPPGLVVNKDSIRDDYDRKNNQNKLDDKDLIPNAGPEYILLNKDDIYKLSNMLANKEPERKSFNVFESKNRDFVTDEIENYKMNGGYIKIPQVPPSAYCNPNLSNSVPIQDFEKAKQSKTVQGKVSDYITLDNITNQSTIMNQAVPISGYVTPVQLQMLSNDNK